MANVKISNLTAATTPLAGTEVLPVVQSGTTVKASIANVQTATYSGGTANGVAYLNGSKVLTTGSALTFDGTNLTATNGATIQGLTVGRGAGAQTLNTAVGASALATNSTGVACTAVGYQALQLSTVDGNTAVGRIALQATSTGAQNTAVGAGAAPLNTTGTGLVALGANALGANTTGSSNVGVGRDSLASNTTASNNTAVGYQAGYSGSTGGNNIAVGYQAGYTNVAGQYNVFIGYQAGYTSNYTAVTAVGNTCIGTQAGYGLTTGTNNTFIGPASSNSGYYVTTGSKNTIIGGYNGNQGGLDIRTASNYIVLSDGDGNPRLWVTNGPFLFCPAVYADTAVASANVGVLSTGEIYRTTSSLKYKNNVLDATHGLADVMKLRPVTYKSKRESENNLTYGGLIAEEVHAAGLTEFVAYADDGTPDALHYSNMVSLAFKAIQELKAEVDSLKAQINGASA